MRERRKHELGSGRHFTMYGSILMMIWPAYELYIRIDDIRIFLIGARNYCRYTGNSFAQMLWIMFKTTPEIRTLLHTLLFLLFCVIFGICALCMRNRSRACVVMLAGGVVLGIAGGLLNIYGFGMTKIVQLLKLIPLLMVIAGSIVTITGAHLKKRRDKYRKRDDGEDEVGKNGPEVPATEVKQPPRQETDEYKTERSGSDGPEPGERS